MFTLSLVLACAAILPFGSAWLPNERHIQNLQGRNLFRQENLTETDPAKRWLPGKTPIRGVNLGSQFIVEPWMASNEWSNMGCGNAASEFDCVLAEGQSTANGNWANHWNSWITQGDIQQMASYSLNTIRIPLGYWIFEGIKYDSEYFPDGALPYLDNIVGWASDEGFYIILDLHGAPFAQARNAFTGQMAQEPSDSSPDFYQTSQFERAYWFLGNLTQRVHTNNNYRNVGMIEIVNEPISQSQDSDLTNLMRQQYYPNAYATIRNVENSLGISNNNYLHIQAMDTAWGSGSPEQYLSNNYFMAYDDHNYIGFSGTNPDQGSYLSAACQARGGDWPIIVGEWSLHITDAHQWDSQFWPINNNLAFYQSFFAKQARTYEQQEGWIFWSWKTNLGDPRWDYQGAVQAGIIPQNLDDMPSNPC